MLKGCGAIDRAGSWVDRNEEQRGETVQIISKMVYNWPIIDFSLHGKMYAEARSYKVSRELLPCNGER
jgi:hypothetical protein